MLLSRFRFQLLTSLLVVVGAGPLGCSSSAEEGCLALCDFTYRCAFAPEMSGTEEDCIDQCEELAAADPAYADAVADFGSCIEGVECNEPRDCIPAGE
jgi:hypothetical protein